MWSQSQDLSQVVCLQNWGSHPLLCAIFPCLAYEHRKFLIVTAKHLLTTFNIIYITYSYKILFMYCNTSDVECLGREIISPVETLSIIEVMSL